MRIAVTGASGKVGAAFVRTARAAGHSLLLLGRQCPAEFAASTDFHPLDLAAPAPDDALTAALAGVDSAVHIAARVDINPAGDAALLEMYRINVLGTRHLIGSLAAAGVGHVVITSTANLYDPAVPLASEATPIRPVSRTLYLSSKAAQEMVARQGCADAGLACATVRLSSVVGGDGADLLSNLVGKVARGETITLANPEYGTDFVSMRSVAEGLLIAAEHRLAGDYNLSSGKRFTLPEIVALIGARLDKAPLVDLGEGPATPDPGFPAVDCGRLKAAGYQPEPIAAVIDRMIAQLG